MTAVRVVRDAKTNIGKGIAFVEFTGRPAARMAMAADGRVLRDREIRVTRVAKSGAAAAAAADAAAAGGSRLRTPFSRGKSLCLSVNRSSVCFRLRLPIGLVGHLLVSALAASLCDEDDRAFKPSDS